MKKYLLTSVFLLSAGLAFSQAEVEPYRQFDFWVGEWNVYHSTADTLVGISKIESIIDGKGILENYHTPAAYKGKSLNTYNAQTQEWEQYWIDNGGTVLKLSGKYSEGKMVMGDRIASGDTYIRNKITWTPLENGYVTQVWEVSQDDGKSWQKVFDGTYKPRVEE